ncbi:hypothetical protein FE697_016905 [Mumia zhuanghuii]|uniref:Uncharacterized protein n=2 Tax=Mumia TaxID=1546255 RepID=A0ABW1QRN0_9ACTN|nr:MULTISPECIES: hypothetical protein [Mumia]KAA1420627.1 hypothetical protein FE697_016905 [Mumia zhuanghuii]
MPFRLIRPESLPWLDVASPSPADADRAAAQLRDDYERWSRWSLGLFAFVVAILGLFTALGIASTAYALDVGVHLVDVVAVLVAGGIGLAGTSVLALLWRSGRRLTRAAAAWTRLPYEVSGRTRTAAGWLGARTVNVEARIFVRVTTSTLALLLAVACISVAVRDVVTGTSTVTLAAAAVGVLALLCGLGQMGGVLRIVSGLSEADPLWHRIRTSVKRG